MALDFILSRSRLLRLGLAPLGVRARGWCLLALRGWGVVPSCLLRGGRWCLLALLRGRGRWCLLALLRGRGRWCLLALFGGGGGGAFFPSWGRGGGAFLPFFGGGGGGGWVFIFLSRAAARNPRSLPPRRFSRRFPRGRWGVWHAGRTPGFAQSISMNRVSCWKMHQECGDRTQPNSSIQPSNSMRKSALPSRPLPWRSARRRPPVPPVARRSSTRITRSPGPSASSCI